MATSFDRRSVILGIAASVLAIALPELVLAADAGPLDFARSLYALKNYWSDVTQDDITTALYLDANLAALVKANYARQDFDAALDYDPLVQAQDWDEIITHFTVLSQTGKHADVNVAIENLGETTAITLRLSKTADGWRLSDIIAEDNSSLVDELKQLNAQPAGDN